MNAIQPLSPIEANGNGILILVVVVFLISQILLAIVLWAARSELRADFREVFLDLKAVNRSLGHLEGLDTRVSNFEKNVDERITLSERSASERILRIEKQVTTIKEQIAD